MTTINDLELNHLLVRVAQLQPIVSHYIRSGNLRSAADHASNLQDVVRKIDWRIQELLTGKEAP